MKSKQRLVSAEYTVIKCQCKGTTGISKVGDKIICLKCEGEK